MTGTAGIPGTGGNGLPKRRGRGIPGYGSTRTTLVRAIKTAAKFSPLLFVLLSALVHLLQPEFNPWQDAVSMLVWGRGGWIQTATFYLLAFSVVILTLKLLAGATVEKKFRVGIMLLGLIGVGFLIVGICPSAAPGAPQTLTGRIHLHTVAGIVILFPVVCFLMAPGLRAKLSCGWVSAYTHITGILMLMFMTAATVVVFGHFGWIGMIERFMLLNGLAWIQVISIRAL